MDAFLFVEMLCYVGSGQSYFAINLSFYCFLHMLTDSVQTSLEMQLIKSSFLILRVLSVHQFHNYHNIKIHSPVFKIAELPMLCWVRIKSLCNHLEVLFFTAHAH